MKDIHDPGYTSQPDEKAQAVLRGRRIDLLVCDVDGTLVNSNEQLTGRVAARITEAGQRGMKICIASGRPQLGLLEIHRALRLATPIVSSGGADLYDPVTAQFLIHRTLRPADVRCITQAGREAKVSVLFEFTDHMLLEGDYREAQRLSARVAFDVPYVEDGLTDLTEMPTKIVLVGDTPTLAALQSSIGAECDTVFIAKSQADFLDFTAGGVNKGSALEVLCRHLDIPLQQTAAIGDSFNDESMLKLAGVSVCVRNAHPALVQAADLVAPSNDESGVAWLLEQIFYAS
ncbi:MAG: HAD family phosphatase [Anaerolineales bacterium]|nr:HAD family phosphatase [Anaerolineales bacterium]